MHEKSKSVISPQLCFSHNPINLSEGLENHSRITVFFKYAKDKQKMLLNNKIIFLSRIIIRKSCQHIREIWSITNYKRYCLGFRSWIPISSRILENLEEFLKIENVLLNTKLRSFLLKLKKKNTWFIGTFFKWASREC